MTKSEKSYLDRVASLGCVVCRNLGYGPTPAILHHIREGQGMAQRAPDVLVIPLCPTHHKGGGLGVAYHDGEKSFEAMYGTELELLAQTIAEAM